MAEIIEMLMTAGCENDLNLDDVMHTAADVDDGVVFGVDEE
jgi:hypothetical protein